MIEVYSECNKYLMIDHLQRVIKLLVEIKGEIYPMAVAVDLNNKLKIEIDIVTSDQPSFEEMVLRYDNLLNKMLRDKEILCYCIAVDTITSKDHKSKGTDTIVFMSKSIPEEEAEISYYSYIINKVGKFEVTDVWESDRKQVV